MPSRVTAVIAMAFSVSPACRRANRMRCRESVQELVDSLKADPNQFGDVAHRQTLTVKSSYNRSRRERHRDLHRSALSRRAALGIHPQETSRGGSKRQLPFTQCLGSNARHATHDAMVDKDAVVLHSKD